MSFSVTKGLVLLLYVYFSEPEWADTSIFSLMKTWGGSYLLPLSDKYCHSISHNHHEEAIKEPDDPHLAHQY